MVAGRALRAMRNLRPPLSLMTCGSLQQTLTMIWTMTESLRWVQEAWGNDDFDLFRPSINSVMLSSSPRTLTSTLLASHDFIPPQICKVAPPHCHHRQNQHHSQL
ncbi:hypothetical protein BT69DRAFT_748630 [Atractiella rhizophila]|nr:hypothetical protein BT69DRAFT_748630 [Atractiella rhizophila]